MLGNAYSSVFRIITFVSAFHIFNIQQRLKNRGSWLILITPIRVLLFVSHLVGGIVPRYMRSHYPHYLLRCHSEFLQETHPLSHRKLPPMMPSSVVLIEVPLSSPLQGLNICLNVIFVEENLTIMLN